MEISISNSVKKWEDIVNEVGIDNGYLNCPLCQEYYDENTFSCGDCPIVKKSGEQHCWNTPYVEWKNHIENEHNNNEKKIYCEKCKELAQKELDFLKLVV